jgi:hypothetical protein
LWWARAGVSPWRSSTTASSTTNFMMAYGPQPYRYITSISLHYHRLVSSSLAGAGRQRLQRYTGACSYHASCITGKNARKIYWVHAQIIIKSHVFFNSIFKSFKGYLSLVQSTSLVVV